MDFLINSFLETDAITWVKYLTMWAIGGVLIFLAIKKEMEPALLLPMGFGCILVNIPLTNVITQPGEAEGIIDWLFRLGIEASEAMPILLFIGIGAMIDFGPLLSNPKLMIFGAAAQFGIFATLLGAIGLSYVVIGGSHPFAFGLKEAASIMSATTFSMPHPGIKKKSITG